jgi:hypothetical protein
VVLKVVTTICTQCKITALLHSFRTIGPMFVVRCAKRRDQAGLSKKITESYLDITEFTQVQVLIIWLYS